MATDTFLKSTLVDLTWYDAANWTQGLPVAGVVAHINGKRSVTLRLAPLGGASAKAGELSISAAAVGLFGGQLLIGGVSGGGTQPFDLELKQSATLTIASTATLSGAGTMAMGLDGSATKMRVNGTVFEDYALVASGQLAILGSGHWITGSSGIAVGGANGASLLIANGGVVDEGRKGLSQYADSLAIGEGAGSGAVRVTGLGSLAAFTEVYVGVNGEARLTIANGGVVQDDVGVVALNGDGYVLVTGQGSRWDNFGGLTVGEVYPTDSTLTITNGGQVDWGVGGLGLHDTMKLDGSATLGGQYIYDGGEILALAGHGDVRMSQDIVIASNWLYNFADVAFFYAQKGVTLSLTGQITGGDLSDLRVGVSDVAVTNAGNHFGHTEIYGGVLEVWATGALGAGAVNFIGGTKTHAELAIEGGTHLDNLIVGFAATDRIDLGGFQFTDTIAKSWTENALGTAGTLALDNGVGAFTLQFAGARTASDFQLTANTVAGSTLTLAHGAV